MSESAFGLTLVLPSELIVPSPDKGTLDPVSFVGRLKEHMAAIRPAITRPQASSGYKHKDLDTCTHVWVRVDDVRKSLQPPYKGPFVVKKRTPKYFVIDNNGKPDKVSLDRLKVAYLDDAFLGTLPSKERVALRSEQLPKQDTHTSTSVTHTHIDLGNTIKPPDSSVVAPQTADVPDTTVRTTRSGRKVHWPKKYVQVVLFDPDHSL